MRFPSGLRVSLRYGYSVFTGYTAGYTEDGLVKVYWDGFSYYCEVKESDLYRDN